MADSKQAEVRISTDGRLTIPVSLRRALDLKPGTILIARIDGARFVLETRENILARLRGLFAHIPKDVSLADELIAERRAEARREEAS